MIKHGLKINYDWGDNFAIDTPDDISLLKHETAEAWYMKKNGLGYTKAHDVAQKRFPAPQMEGK